MIRNVLLWSQNNFLLLPQVVVILTHCFQHEKQWHARETVLSKTLRTHVSWSKHNFYTYIVMLYLHVGHPAIVIIMMQAHDP